MNFEKIIKNGLYFISDENLLGRRKFISAIEKAAACGIKAVQIREKKTSLKDRARLCEKAAAVIRPYGAKLIINDDPYLAKICGADGVHIGKNDGSVERAREILGKNAIVGVSCYGSIDSAIKAQKSGADYVSFGNFFFSFVKPEEEIVSTDIISAAKKKIKIPVLAIGGINEKNCGEIFLKGADGVCCVSAFIMSKDIKETAAKIEQIKRRAYENKNEK